MDITSKAAYNSTCKSKHAASIYRSGALLALGINRSRLQNSYYNWWEDGPVPSEHAEIAAIRLAGPVDLTGCVMYVSRVNSHGEAMSRPCDTCHTAIIKAGIKKVIYTTGV